MIVYEYRKAQYSTRAVDSDTAPRLSRLSDGCDFFVYELKPRPNEDGAFLLSFK